jgi:hypothetical protein
MQQCLKPAAGAARTRIVAAQFLDEDLAVADDAQAALDAGFGVSAATALGGGLQQRFGLESCARSDAACSALSCAS